MKKKVIRNIIIIGIVIIAIIIVINNISYNNAHIRLYNEKKDELDKLVTTLYNNEVTFISQENLVLLDDVNDDDFYLEKHGKWYIQSDLIIEKETQSEISSTMDDLKRYYIKAITVTEDKVHFYMTGLTFIACYNEKKTIDEVALDEEVSVSKIKEINSLWWRVDYCED